MKELIREWTERRSVDGQKYLGQTNVKLWNLHLIAQQMAQVDTLADSFIREVTNHFNAISFWSTS